MIEASFNPGRNNQANVTGAVQYDTGQRLLLRGLPVPEELAQRDDFLSGDAVTVQVQYAYEGDSQTESRLASYDEQEDAWRVDVPDAYLQKSYPVGFFVYVSYGSDEERVRSKTMYTGAFKPKERPAPGDQVTPDQKNAWDALVEEVNLAISNTNAATSNANAAASVAVDAAGKADDAASNANEAADNANKIGNATAEAVTLEPGSKATVGMTEENGVKKFTFGIPRGADGPTGPAGVTFSLSGTTLTITTTE